MSCFAILFAIYAKDPMMIRDQAPAPPKITPRGYFLQHVYFGCNVFIIPSDPSSIYICTDNGEDVRKLCNNVPGIKKSVPITLVPVDEREEGPKTVEKEQLNSKWAMI